MNPKGIIAKAYIVPGLPHVLLAPERSPGWASLRKHFDDVRSDIEKQEADLILYFSTQWLSVIGYLFQADPEPKWVHVDANWHELGSIPYEFKVDADFGKAYCEEMKKVGAQAATVNYRGFPIDTGTIVAQKLLNPDNRLPSGMVSCNMYVEKDKTLSLGRAGARALVHSGKRAVVVLVSSLSHRYHVTDIDPAKDKISSLKDDEWNRKVLEILGEGRLEDADQCAREFAKQANADLGFKGIWWLNGICGQSNNFSGKVWDYQSIWGTGAALVGLTPTKPVMGPSREGLTEGERRLLGLPIESDGSEHDISHILAGGIAAGIDEGAPLCAPTEEKSPGVGAHSGAPSTSKADRSAKADTVVYDGGGDARQVVSSRAPEPVGPYPHARREGNLIFVSGIGPRQRGSKEIPGLTLDAKGNIQSHDVAVQTRAVIENIRAILEEAGSSLENIVDVQAFLTDMKRDFREFNKVYDEYFRKVGATRTTVEVTSLPTPIAVELKVIARA